MRVRCMFASLLSSAVLCILMGCTKESTPAAGVAGSTGQKSHETSTPETEMCDPAPTTTDEHAEAAPSGKVTLGSPDLTAGIPGDGPLSDAQLTAWLDDPKNHEQLQVELPLGLAGAEQQMVGLADNPLTRAKIELGRQLYFDTRLSADNGVSCASCHHPGEGYARHTQFGEGIGGQKGNRNSPVSYNRILSGAQFWDGRAASLEEQAKGPIANPIEMGSTHDVCVATIGAVPAYARQFTAVFGDSAVSIDNVAHAIAAFERCLVSGPSPYDYYSLLIPFKNYAPEDLEDDPELKKYARLKADSEAHPISESAIRGRELFFSDRVGCSTCHAGANFTDERYHNLGIGMDQEKPDLGRYEITKDEKDHGAFKTPTVRNVELSGPYMHDGGLKTLEEVVEWYAKGGHPNPHLSDKIKKIDLTPEEKADLVEFMKSLTGEFPGVRQDRIPGSDA